VRNYPKTGVALLISSRKHTSERPFQCHCSRRFSRLDNLRQHAQTVHVNEEIPMDSLAATGEFPAKVDKLQAWTSYHEYGDFSFSDRPSVFDNDTLDDVSSLSSWSTPASDVVVIRHGFGDEQPANSWLSPETASRPSFNIERDGDPRIEWFMYYDFIVTKTEAYYQLKPDYLATDKYPTRVTQENVIM
jgi:hypothetical protein